jgi:type VI secretion system secreted protein VgrG
VAQNIRVDISINGKKISPFSYLSLRQEINGHHHFELRFNHDVLEEKHAVNINQSKNFLGKNITIAFNTLAPGKPDKVFKGIVTDIGIANNFASPGDLVFRGYSPTILLETGPTNQSHLQRSLKQIITDTLGSIPSNDLATRINPEKKSSLPYTVQYRESNFAFIRRLAAEYGEWFFYDGETLNFGPPAQADNFTLQYPNDISNINLHMRLLPVNFEHSSYLSKENRKVAAQSSSQQISGLDDLGKHALKTSEQLFNKPTNTLSPRKFLDAKEVDESVKISKGKNSANMVILNAQSDFPFIKIGCTVQVSGVNHVSNSNIDYGKFMVTSVIHQADGHGNYHNEFEAVPSSIAIPPNGDIHKPIAEAQIATVTDNKDPDNLGKVKVQMVWQKNNATTPFIKVLTPHSGTRNGDRKNRGLFFTPEVGDFVIVGFTQNDPDRPFVMGSVPHGNSIDTTKNTENHVKAIRTRTGSTIYFHDKENDKEQEIRIEVDEKNYISVLVNDGDGTIKVYSTKEIEVDAKESITVKSGKTINIKSEKITIEASDSITMQANNKIDIKSKEITINGSEKIEAKGDKSVKIESEKIEAKGTQSAKLSGAQLDLEGNSMANLKGGLVKIN